MIYLFRNKSVDYFDDRLSESDRREHSKGVFIGSKLISMITGGSDSDINTFTKHFNIDRIHFKDNKLIALNEIDAIDRNGSPIEAVCKKEWNLRNPKSRQIHLKTRLSTVWALSVVRGIQAIVFGNRDPNNDWILKNTQFIKVESIPSQCREYWTEAKQFSIFEQILDFIKSCVDSETELYEFEYKVPEKSIVCHKSENSGDNCDYFLTKDYKQ